MWKYAITFLEKESFCPKDEALAFIRLFETLKVFGS